MTGRWLTFFVNIYCKEGGWEGSTWKCRASYFSPNTACCRESKGIKQPSLPTANNRDVLSDAYIIQTGKTIWHNSVPEAIFIDVSITSHDPYVLVSSFTADCSCICKKGLGRSALSVHSVTFFPPLSLLPHFYLSPHPFVWLHLHPKLSIGTCSGSRNCW